MEPSKITVWVERLERDRTIWNSTGDFQQSDLLETLDELVRRNAGAILGDAKQGLVFAAWKDSSHQLQYGRTFRLTAPVEATIVELG